VIFIEVEEDFQDFFSESILENAARMALEGAQLDKLPSLSIKICGDQEIQQLNAVYRGMDNVTDVLSFTADYYDPDLETRYLGDVVISFPRAVEQAKKRGHPAEAELQLLTVHGVLHLLGYDHSTAVEKEAMWDIQDRILLALDLDIQVEDEG